MNTYMSTPGNTAKLGTAHSNIQTAQSSQPWLGANLQCISQHTTESAHQHTTQMLTYTYFIFSHSFVSWYFHVFQDYLMRFLLLTKPPILLFLMHTTILISYTCPHCRKLLLLSLIFRNIEVFWCRRQKRLQIWFLQAKIHNFE